MFIKIEESQKWAQGFMIQKTGLGRRKTEVISSSLTCLRKREDNDLVMIDSNVKILLDPVYQL